MSDAENPSHAFKNQLTVIRGFSELLIAETPDGDPRRRDLEEIHKAAMAALDLLARLYPAGPATAR
jgi:signal transduction histidine kinase